MLRLSTVIALALVGWGANRLYAQHHHRRTARPRAQPEFLQTWEGEGGGVPVNTHRTAASQVRADERAAAAREEY